METLQQSTHSSASERNLAASAKCLHQGCTCLVTTGEHYCSDYCAKAANMEHSKGDHECACGHAECTHALGMTPVAPPPLS